MFGVVVNAHVVEFTSAFGITDSLHERGGLRLFAFVLFAGDCADRHQGPVWGRSGWSNGKGGNVGRRNERIGRWRRGPPASVPASPGILRNVDLSEAGPSCR